MSPHAAQHTASWSVLQNISAQELQAHGQSWLPKHAGGGLGQVWGSGDLMDSSAAAPVQHPAGASASAVDMKPLMGRLAWACPSCLLHREAAILVVSGGLLPHAPFQQTCGPHLVTLENASGCWLQTQFHAGVMCARQDSLPWSQCRHKHRHGACSCSAPTPALHHL
jgi:hypothetical protein